MTPIEEALDALTDAMKQEQNLCAKGLVHNHPLLRKLQHAVKRLEPLVYDIIIERSLGENNE